MRGSLRPAILRLREVCAHSSVSSEPTQGEVSIRSEAYDPVMIWATTECCQSATQKATSPGPESHSFALELPAQCASTRKVVCVLTQRASPSSGRGARIYGWRHPKLCSKKRL